MPNNPFIAYAIRQMQTHPEKLNTPMGQQFMKLLQSNDEQGGNEMADNMLKNMGSDRQNFFTNFIQRR